MAVILDRASRAVVGWAMHTTLEQALAQAALRMALLRHRPAPGLLHHADRGVQYAANDYQALLVAHAITPSMSRQGNCYDNAVVARFFATLAWELIAGAEWDMRAEARAAMFEYIEVWYNRHRRIQHLDMSAQLPTRHNTVRRRERIN